MRVYRVRNSFGFSLIEIMIVMTIIVVILSFGTSYFGNQNRVLKSKIRQFVILGKQIQSRAKLTGRVHRLVLNFGFKEEEENKKRQSYWVETGSGGEILADQNFLEVIKKEEETTEDEKENSEDLESGEKDFHLAESLLRKPVKLPKGIRFKSLELTHQKEAISDGKAYVYFFPNGFVEEAALHVRFGEKLNWTVYFQPYTGRMELVKKNLDLKSFRGE